MSDTPPEIVIPHPPDTNPNGWDDHGWLANTWKLLQDVKREVERNTRDIRSQTRLIVDLDRHMVEGFKRLGVRIRDAEARASQSQVDAQEARTTAKEVESTAIRTFVDDAKPFAHWKRYLLSGAVGVLFTLLAAAIAKACGLTPLG